MSDPPYLSITHGHVFISAVIFTQILIGGGILANPPSILMPQFAYTVYAIIFVYRYFRDFGLGADIMRGLNL